jgi:hypothetical protein
MSKTVRAKFTVTSKVPHGYGGTTVCLSAVYSSDPHSENKAFSDATPSGQISISIADGKPALDAFEMGKAYYVDFTPAEQG